MSDPIMLPEFKFKGRRNYIHGTDLFQSITKFQETYNAGYIQEMSFRLFGNKQSAILFVPPNKTEYRTISHGCWFNSEAGSNVKFWVVEKGDPVSDRYQFDEDALCFSAELSEDTIFMPFNCEFLMIENIVALTKRFHNEKFPLDKGKWVFGQIVLYERLPNRSSLIQIDNYQNIKGRFSRNRIVLDGHLFGEIRFIVS